MESQDFDLGIFISRYYFRLGYISVTFRIVFQDCFYAPLSAWIVALVSTMDQGCCGSTSRKELLHVSNVGADSDLFNITTMGVPWIESKASVGLQDADLVKHGAAFVTLCSFADPNGSFCLRNWAAPTAGCIAWDFFIPNNSRIAFLNRRSL